MPIIYFVRLSQRRLMRCIYQGGLVVLLCVLSFTSSVFAECQTGRVKVQVLGSGGPEMSDARASSSYLVWLDGKSVLLVDAGSGSSLNFEQSGARLADLQVVAFTHFHVDHSADFPTLIKASFFTDRNTNLRVYGPQGNHLMPSATEFVQGMLGKRGVYRYLNGYVTASESSAYKIRTENVPILNRTIQDVQPADSLSLFAIAVHHGPVPALAWRVEAAECVIVFSGDMNNQYQTLKKLANGADILIAHNAIPESAQGVARKLHMLPSEIGKIAAQAKVKKLVLSHRMMRTLGREQETLKIIRQSYKGPLKFADDMDVILP